MSGETVYCRDCGSEIASRAEICPECGIRQRPPDDGGDSGTDPGIAAAASFIIPGLGQVINGQLAKGIILGVLTAAFALTGVGLILAIPLWLWLVYDAYNTASEDETETLGDAESRRANAAVINALNWYESENDSTKTARVRRRFQTVDSISTLTDDELNHLIDVIDAYQESVESTPILTEARRACVDELR